MLTPLHVAADRCHVDIMEILLKHAADVNALDRLGQTAMHRCAQQGSTNACRVLLDHGADVNIVSLQGYTAVQIAPENVQGLLQGCFSSQNLVAFLQTLFFFFYF